MIPLHTTMLIISTSFQYHLLCMQFLFFAGQQVLLGSATSGYMYILIPVAVRMYVVKRNQLKLP